MSVSVLQNRTLRLLYMLTADKNSGEVVSRQPLPSGFTGIYVRDYPESLFYGFINAATSVSPNTSAIVSQRMSSSIRTTTPTMSHGETLDFSFSLMMMCVSVSGIVYE